MEAKTQTRRPSARYIIGNFLVECLFVKSQVNTKEIWVVGSLSNPDETKHYRSLVKFQELRLIYVGEADENESVKQTKGFDSFDHFKASFEEALAFFKTNFTEFTTDISGEKKLGQRLVLSAIAEDHAQNTSVQIDAPNLVPAEQPS